jgi:hypothetical protein
MIDLAFISAAGPDIKLIECKKRLFGRFEFVFEHRSGKRQVACAPLWQEPTMDMGSAAGELARLWGSMQ